LLTRLGRHLADALAKSLDPNQQSRHPLAQIIV
jgi:hypothetical protein